MLSPFALFHHRHWLQRTGIALLLTALLTACVAPASTPTPPLRPTNTPTPKITPTNTPLAAPVVILPDDIIQQAEQIAKQKGLTLSGSWAPEHTTLYALPGPGLIYLFSANQIPADLRTDKQALSGRLDNVVLGILFVTDAASDLPTSFLRPGVYVLALGQAGNLVNFIGDKDSREVQADIRTFKSDLIAARPFALISSEQMCLSWDALQVCARQRTPLPDQLQDDLQKAALSLGATPELFANERGILDIEGVNNLERCADAVKGGEFAGCQPSILVAPISRKGLDAPPPPEFDPLKSSRADLASLAPAPRLETGQAGLVGIAVVFSETLEEVYRDPQLLTPARSLPADAYLLYDILFTSDPQMGTNDGQPITLSRVELRLSPAVKFYLPDVRNVPLLGTSVNSTPPADAEPEAAAVHLLIKVFGRQICLFKARECPGLRNAN